MPAAYEIRAGGDVKNKKQSMADLKLRRLNELNMRLKEDLERPRIRVSEASMSLIQYCNSTKDFMVPSLWGQVIKSNRLLFGISELYMVLIDVSLYIGRQA
ncbi:Guanine nucleotide-binding protein subunit gamma [Ptychographa xylographoides]|nr:Guanine nucleotide-binding protein subunit gamma [Ptychographa xylographoides]